MASWFDKFLIVIQPYLGILRLILIILVSFIILSLFLKIIKKILMKKIKTKKQISTVTVFLDLLKYLFVFFFIIIVVFTYYDNWGELGFIAGLLTVAIGWALQKPISGVVAWLIIITRRPFGIGDRILVTGARGEIKGDITNISLTHIMLNEVGGTTEGEETSRRSVIVPNSILFEQEIINYTDQDEYILYEVSVTITYESNLEKAEKIMISSVFEIMKPYWKSFPKKVSKESHIRLNFKDSGINLTVRYNTIATNRNKIATDIRREIHKLINAEEDVEFAYPHTEVLFREKGK